MPPSFESVPCATDGTLTQGNRNKPFSDGVRVHREQVIRAFILSSAKVTRYRNRQPLVDQGVDVSLYAADFEAEDRL